MSLLHGLDAEQSRAVTLEVNGIAAAGAGSGKTRVLASRYAWLITEKNLAPEEILTLTFTNKAVSEMYSRIYRYLLEQAGTPAASPAGAGNEKAAAALKNFHKARISTLDAFSAGVARVAAARYGISPDFKSDDAGLKDLAKEAALRFVLDNREDPAIRELLVDNKIRDIAEEIFARIVLKHSPVSSPLDTDKIISLQKEHVLRVWREKTRQAELLIKKITGELHTLSGMKKPIKLVETLTELLLKNPLPVLPDILHLLEVRGASGAGNAGSAAKTGSDESRAAKTGSDESREAKTGSDESREAAARQQLKKYFEFFSELISGTKLGRPKEEYSVLAECYRLLKGEDKDGLYHELESIANYACSFNLCAGVFTLINKFQTGFNIKKRETGFLSFNDIAHLAVDALRDHPDIRKVYKDSLKMIMIDEFQDNNALQRDLVYLLAENPERNKKGIAGPEELEKNRMFFVGDEKQSIYRFRGADVAVFRSLSKNFHGLGETIELNHNYRSRPGLINAFNQIFGQVFLSAPSGFSEKSDDLTGGASLPDYEAIYRGIKAPENPDCEGAGRSGPELHFCFLNAADLPKDKKEGIKSQDLEAVFIAKKIRDLVMSGEKIPRRKDDEIVWEACTWSDFAVLERSYTHQSSLEKYFREFGIPYNTDRPSGLFNDAPILDLRSFLRLIVYPEDRIAYASLIRSPFMRLSDQCLAVCLLSSNPEPFAEENEPLVPEDDRALYCRAGKIFRALRDESRLLSITELITKLWYDVGYRYETIWTGAAQVYENLFDLFFSFACEAEASGKNLAEFIDYLEDIMNREERPDDRDIPGEGEAGVRIMSIHKSKGLEFPLVFIFDCAHSSNTGNKAGLLNYNTQFGIILKLPQAEELPLGGNYFRDIIEEEEKAKDVAELRRLLYVAMTRAESRLFVTVTLPAQTQDEKKEWDMEGLEFNEETIRQRLIQFSEKNLSRETFLSFLAPVLPSLNDPDNRLCTFEAIPVMSRAEISQAAKQPEKQPARQKQVVSCMSQSVSPMSQREAFLAAESVYENAEIIPAGEGAPISLEASKLKYLSHEDIDKEKMFADNAASVAGASIAGAVSPSLAGFNLDSLLEKTGISSAEFGTIVHSVLEARFTGELCNIPIKIRARLDEGKSSGELMVAAEKMADVFFDSDLGKRWAASSRRESEFSIITSANVNGKPISIMGQIDLLFEEAGEVVVVDFKTDRIINPSEHYGQLAAYYRAASDIFGKPASVWLFYLCYGLAEDTTRNVKELSLDKIAGDSFDIITS